MGREGQRFLLGNVVSVAFSFPAAARTRFRRQPGCEVVGWPKQQVHKEQTQDRGLKLKSEGVRKAVSCAETRHRRAYPVANASRDRAEAKPHRFPLWRRHGHRPHRAPDALQGLRRTHHELRRVHEWLRTQIAERSGGQRVERQTHAKQNLRVAELQRAPPHHRRDSHADLVHRAQKAKLRRRPRALGLLLDRVQAGGGCPTVVGHEHLHHLTEHDEYDASGMPGRDNCCRIRKLVLDVV
mmetsp:Transcript_33371/g.92125  ORF Transcript_33371/g.92125 Transcript_33371/m.92125 type:complete len:240 (-) Transcript_33371:256-975(-)